MIQVRLEYNSFRGQAGDIVEVDPDDREVKGLLSAGMITQLDERTRQFCLQCDPPSFHVDKDALAGHVKAEHAAKESRGLPE